MSIRIVSIVGTVRPNNMTAKALAVVNDALAAADGVELEVIDPATLELGFPGRPSPDAGSLKETVRDAVGVVLSTPEYHGSYSSALKQVIENLGFPSALKGKPVALLGVAGGVIGAIKSLEHLSSVCTHIGALVLPGAVSVARVGTVFDEEGRCTDPAIDKRLRGLGDALLNYIHDHVCPRLYLEEMVRESA